MRRVCSGFLARDPAMTYTFGGIGLASKLPRRVTGRPGRAMPSNTHAAFGPAAAASSRTDAASRARCHSKAAALRAGVGNVRSPWHGRCSR
jgi:hypothetical protein